MRMATAKSEMPSFVAVYSTIPKLTECLRTILPKIHFQEVLPEAGGNALKLLRDVEIIVADNNLVGLQLYNLESAKWVQGTWAGVEKLLAHYNPNKPKPSFIFTRYSNFRFGCAMGEYVVANIVNHERDFMTVYDNKKNGMWNTDGKISNHRTLSDLTVGILGTGIIGADVAKFLKTFKARVWGMVRKMPEGDMKSPYVDEYRLTSDLPELLSNCDYIINVLPSTAETTGILNGDILKLCAAKKSVFINVGRGSIINEEDLVNALNQGWLSAAILDVFQNEPLPASSPLWTMPQVKITPHVAGVTRPEDVASFFKDNLERYLARQPLNGVLDFERGY